MLVGAIPRQAYPNPYKITFLDEGIKGILSTDQRRIE